jgi:FKBP-type peptidyl-prolyl cis-trans isomerase
MRKVVLIILACLAVTIVGCGGDEATSVSSGETSASTAADSSAAPPTKPKVEVPDGAPPTKLESRDLVQGDGPVARAGDEVTVQYVGVDYRSGEQFDASWDRGEPFTFPLGAGEVIQGWDQGVQGMKVGGRRELIVPPKLGYGSQQVGPIAPNSTLIFVVDLISVN